MFPVQIITVCMLVVCSFASPIGEKLTQFRGHHVDKYSYICESHENETLCEEAKIQCQNSWRESKEVSGNNETKKNFDTCIKKLDIVNFLQNFEASLEEAEVKRCGGHEDFFLDIDTDNDYENQTDVDLSTNVDDIGEESKDSDDCDHSHNHDDDSDEHDNDNHDHDDHDHDNDDHDHEDAGHNHRKHGSLKGIAMRFLNSLTPDKSEAFRCCVENLKGNLKDGSLDRQETVSKISTMMEIDPTALKGFSKGIDSCKDPEACNMHDFKGCILKSCVDEVVATNL